MKSPLNLFRLLKLTVMAMIIAFLKPSVNKAQAVLFDFDNIAAHTPLPVTQTVMGITARFSGTGSGYSIQNANTMGFTPKGFSGNCIYPNAIYLADLLIVYNQKITDFSIMYSCQELGCDDAATMRVTAYLKGTQIGTNTKSASNPGTWPVDTLRCSFQQGFDSIVVHYDKKPPTCQDYGTIFLADNMWVTPYKSGISTETIFEGQYVIPDPVTNSSEFRFTLLEPQHVCISVFDMNGKLLTVLSEGFFQKGEHQVGWNGISYKYRSGIYFLKFSGDHFSRSFKLVIE